MSALSMRTASASQLPQELLPVIFASLEVSDRCRASRVCKLWRRAAHDPPQSAVLKLRICWPEEPELEEDDGADEVGDGADEVTLGGGAGAPHGDDGEEGHAGGGATAGAASCRTAKAAAIPSLTTSVSSSEAAAVLRGPFCTGLQRLVLTLQWAFGADLDDIGRALPRSLTRLEVALDVMPDEALAHAAFSSLRVGENAPALRELFFAGSVPFHTHSADERFVTNAGWHMRSALPAFEPVHASLQYLGAPFEHPVTAAALQALFPAVRGLRSAWVRPALRPTLDELARLAACGVGFHAALFQGQDLSRPEAAAAAVAALRPQPHEVEPTPPRLKLDGCTLPDDWPRAFPAGLQRIQLANCTVRAPMLRWLFGGPHAGTLRAVDVGPRVAFDGVAPAALFAAAAAAVEGSLALDWPVPAPVPAGGGGRPDDAWNRPEAFVEAMRTLAESPRLRSLVDIRTPSMHARSPPERVAFLRYRIARAEALPEESGDLRQLRGQLAEAEGRAADLRPPGPDERRGRWL